MKKAIIIGGLSIFAAACATAPQPQTTVANANTTTKSVDSGLVTSSHSGAQGSQSAATQDAKPNSPPTSGTGGNQSGGGNPMERPIDTSKFDQEIVRAEKEFKAKSTDQTAKKALAEAYADRAFALTEAAQYRAALGDFRKSLKLDATNEVAKKAHDQIVQIFASLNRQPPEEGKEPAPLPFTKET